MPGIIYHLNFANEILKILYRKNGIPYSSDVIEFFSGNLIPDFSVADKELSHFRVSSKHLHGIRVPDLEKARAELLKNGAFPVYLGMYTHLYLDYHFFEYFLPSYFTFSDGVVKNPHSNKEWSYEMFFARPRQGGILYQGYTELNRIVLEKSGIDPVILDKIPVDLPYTGIQMFDTRKEKTWKDDLSEFLSENVPYTGEIIDYDSLNAAIVNIASDFVIKEYNIIG